MSRFADTSFLLALISQRDAAHQRASHLADRSTHIVTTDAVLIETGNSLRGRQDRRFFPGLYARLMGESRDPRVVIIHVDETLLQRGVELYASRLDKEWSLTDCISFVVMRDRGIREALTGDHHFEQAGFVALLK